MTGKDLMMAMGGVSASYVEEAAMEAASEQKPRKVLKKPLILAAAVALLALLVGCGSAIYLTLAEYPGAFLPRAVGSEVPREAVHLTVTGVNPEGIGLRCDLDGFEQEDRAIFILSGGAFTLERKEGENWIPLEEKTPDPEAMPDKVLTTGSYEWAVRWTSSYGLLEPGTYRFSAQVLEDHDPVRVEFTLEGEQPERDPVQSLLDREHYHVRLISGSVYENLDQIPEEYAVLREQYQRKPEFEFTDEYWRSGEDYLHLTYRDEALYMGVMYRDGIKYKLTNEDPNTRLSPIAGWEVWPDYDLNRMTEWSGVLLQGEQTVTYHEDGTIAAIETVCLQQADEFGTTKRLMNIVEVLPTGDGEIDAMIEGQNVDFYREFSWKKDQKDLTPLDVTFRSSGGQPIASSADAIRVAQQECTVEATQIVVYRDEKAGVWKVEFQVLYGYQGYQYVYLSDQGETLMIAAGSAKTG